MGAVPLGLLVTLVLLGGAAWGAFAITLPLLVGSIYAGIATGWLRRSREAPLPARIAAGACIVVSGFTYVVGVVMLILYVRFMILGLKVAGEMFRDWWDREMNK